MARSTTGFCSGAPAALLVLDTSLRIVEVSDAYLAATMRTRDDVLDIQKYDIPQPGGGFETDTGRRSTRRSSARTAASTSSRTGSRT
ncbi:hypothetical protein [Actinoplanes sp. NPDC023714]|uniref:hypothetical protein n=1 Tax=Actinoplanes sp. NPDC023714 TaxID=3154322 RepID=UPI0033EEF8FA